MGQGNSIDAESFQENYYMFFDNNNDEKNKSAYARAPSYNTKLVHRNTDIYSSSTRNDTTLSNSIGTNASKSSSNNEAIDLNSAFFTHDHNLLHNSAMLDDGSFDNLYEKNTNDANESNDGLSVNYTTSVTQESTGSNLSFRETSSPSGKTYTGYWEDDEMVKGKINWIDGRYYEGDVKDKKPHGYGVYVNRRGNEYKGMWLNGLQHGEGTYTTNSDSCPIIRHGIWIDGKLDHWVDDYQYDKYTFLNDILNATTPVNTNTLIHTSSTGEQF